MDPSRLSDFERLLEKVSIPRSALHVSDGFAATGDGAHRGEGRALVAAGILSPATGRDMAERLFAFAGGLDAADEASDDVPWGSYVLAQKPSATVLHLAADAFGTIPLYLMPCKGTCWFSTDPALLLEVAPHVPVRPLGLIEGLHRMQALAPLSHFEGILRVEGSTVATVDLGTGRAAFHRYHHYERRIDAAAHAANTRRGADDLADELESRLTTATRNAIGSHQNVGLLLSGGVDSSMLAAIASREVRITAVHIDQPGPGSELSHARDVARALDLELNVVDFTQGDFRSNFVRSVWAQDTPFLISNGIGLQHAARAGAFDGTDVLIDGEGADGAMFSGTVSHHAMMGYYLRNALSLPDRAVDRFARLVGQAGRTLGMRVDTGEASGLHQLLGARLIEDKFLLRRYDAAFGHIGDASERRLAAQVMHGFGRSLPSMLLRLDAAAKIAGKHVLLPYLDPDYLDFVLNLPAAVKVRRKSRWSLKPERKWLLKKVAARRVPQSAVYRPKAGFGLPAGPWLGSFPAGLADESWLREAFGLSEEHFRHLLADLGTGNDLYFVTSLEVWGRLFDRRESLEAVQARFDDGRPAPSEMRRRAA